MDMIHGHKITFSKCLLGWAFYKTMCPCVHVSMCSLLRYRLNVFLPPLPEVECPIFLEIQNCLGKVVERNGRKFEHFCLKGVLNRFFWQIFSYKILWKPCFMMDQIPLVKGRIANFGIFLDIFEFLRFWWIFPFFKTIGFLGILGPPYSGIGATIRIGQEMLFLPYGGFFL